MAGESRGQSRAEGREGWPDRNGKSGSRRPGVFGSVKAVVAVADARTGHERAPQVAAERNYGRRAVRRGRMRTAGQDTEGTETGRAARYAVTCGGGGWGGRVPAAKGVRRLDRQVGPSYARAPQAVNGSVRQAAGGDPRGRRRRQAGPWRRGPDADSNYRGSTNATLSFENGRK